MMLLPSFSQLDLPHYVERLDVLLSDHLKQVSLILTENKVFEWDNLMQPLELMDDALERFWSPMSHLHAVVDSPALRECYDACLPKLAAYETAMGQNQVLYDALKTLQSQELNQTQRKILSDTLQGFELSGVALSSVDKQRYEAIVTRLSELSNQFSNHVLDATQAFELHVTEEEQSRLQGIPPHAVRRARELAEEKNHSGWIFTLEFPSYLAVITYADDRALRETIYNAYATRASDVGPSAGQFDNTSIMNEILTLRHEKAGLLGFETYANYSLATKMADSTTQVMTFLTDLAQRAHGQAEREFDQLSAFAHKLYAYERLEPWDLAYVSEKQKQSLYAISQEELRPYFPLTNVLDGLFHIVHQLFGIRLEALQGVDTWHPDVRCFRVLDETNAERGYLYMDLFARPHKRGGAWMDSNQSRYKLADGHVQSPIAMLTCNFTQPEVNQPATLLHSEVETLFHEFGHCLHHVLTQVDYLSASGVNGVEWDAVELPSQFLENWCWNEEALAFLTSHVETGEPLPGALLTQMLDSKNFQSAMGMMRQLEFSLFDFHIHLSDATRDLNFISTILAQVRQQTCVVPIAPFNRFPQSFQHIFAGGYGAGYYSYKWAEVLSSDAFSRFEEEGILNAKTGRDFLHCILEVGSSCKASKAFSHFRGRPATVDALLRHNHIQ